MTLTNRETNLAVRLVRGAALKPDDSGKLSARKAEYFEPDRRAPLASYEGEVPREGARVTRSHQFVAGWTVRHISDGPEQPGRPRRRLEGPSTRLNSADRCVYALLWLRAGYAGCWRNSGDQHDLTTPKRTEIKLPDERVALRGAV